MARWHRLGREQAERLGVEQVVVDIRTREDAESRRWVDAIAGAGLIYLSGGKPGLPRRDAAPDRRLARHPGGARERQRRSPGAAPGPWPSRRGRRACATSWRTKEPTGLGLVPHLRVIPHFDRMLGWMPDMLRNAVLQHAGRSDR